MTLSPQIRSAYNTWASFLDTHITFNLKASPIHTKEHEKRVLLFSLAIATMRQLPETEKNILAMAAVFHDTRRNDDGYDVGHGARGAAYYKQCSNAGLLPYSPITHDIIAYHDRDDMVGNRVLADRYPHSHAVLLYHIFKDADALDRFRLGPDGLDPRFLRTEEARALVPWAKEIWYNWPSRTPERGHKSQ